MSEENAVVIKEAAIILRILGEYGAGERNGMLLSPMFKRCMDSANKLDELVKS